MRVDEAACYPLIIPFTVPQNGTRAELQRQLGLQQAVLNSKNPCAAAQDIANYTTVRPFGERARTLERRRLIGNRADQLQAINQNLTRGEAMTRARSWARGRDAIHTLDMVAGGHPTTFSGLGGSSENRSIGSQWGPGGRAQTLSDYAVTQCQNGCPLMQTQLTVI
ncbi:polymorphic toxin type 15 domain-containing protein [Marivita sp. S0852]|uniref:polymorphic toxin type 15 domain-containing protein n=1 Tax=Marivita sp. S0852 TaxID=3373893 RepID=UPI003982B7FA